MIIQTRLLLAAFTVIFLSGCAFLQPGPGAVKEAIIHGDSPTISKASRGDFDFSQPLDEAGNHPLHIAAEAETYYFLDRLERAGALPFAINKAGETPVSILYRKAGNGRPDGWAIEKMDESRKTAVGLLSDAMGGFYTVKDFKSELDPPSFVFDVLGVTEPDQTLAHGLLAAGELKYLEVFLEHGGSFESQYGESQDPVIAAVESGDPQAVAFILNRGYDPNTVITGSVPEDYSMTALSLAVLKGGPKMVQVFIDNDVVVNQAPGPGYVSALHVAASHASAAETLKLLLQNGANVDQQDSSGATALHYAAVSDNPIGAQILLEFGADPNIKTNAGYTPLSTASNSGNGQVIAVLRKGGADMSMPDSNGITELHRAAKAGDIEAVKLVYSAAPGAALKKASDDLTPLILAITNKHVDVAAYLAEVSPESLKISGKDGWTPLQYVLNGKRNYILHPDDRARLVRLFIKLGAPIDKTNSDGLTALYIATLNGMRESMPLLIEAGANVNHADPENGKTLLMRAASNDDLKTLEMLLKAGANPKAKDHKGRTALHHLATRNKPLQDKTYAIMTRRLVGWGADVNARDDRQRTPLMIAARSGNEDIVKALMTSNANPYLRNEDGLTAEFMALEENNYDIVRLIRHLSSLYED